MPATKVNYISSESCITWHVEREQRNTCPSMPRAGARAKYEALRRGIPSNLQYDHFDWSNETLLGSGGFASVSSIPLLDNGARVAVKQETQADTYQHEVVVLKHLTSSKHKDPEPYITQLLGHFKHVLPSGEVDMYTVQPVYQRTLLDVLCPYGDGKPEPLDATRMYKLSVQLTLGIRNYQKHFVIHRDLKMLNVMVDEHGDIKIIDLGLAFLRSVDDPNELREKFPGTLAFAAPEVLMHEEYDAEVDVWAMGVILYLMGTGEHPFADDYGLDTHKILQGDVVIPESARERYGDEWADFVKKLLNRDRDRRPAITELDQLPYFDEISDEMWDALSKPYANTEYLLGIELPEEATSPRTPQIDMATPRLKNTSCFARSALNARNPSSQDSLYFTPPTSPALDSDATTFDAPELEANLSDEFTPEPSPLFTPADSDCEVDPFDLDADVLNAALQKKVEQTDYERLYQDRLALVGLARLA